ncbi:hypothetical protein J2794_005940 [Paraburkholderia terricola]|uniref:hypothetical protein n=1 Tax=Paraburkholderia terricola TaxID=169427 RepID=UPI002864EE64|nr:hypothetical protein [Paraburkholderia terricola]MDR6449802.1 hypothetical protein [Paraburkholderia terricola]
MWRPRSPGPTASFRNSGAFFGTFVGSIGGHATAGAYAHAFQLSLAINALLVLARHRFKLLPVRHQQFVLRRAARPP